MERDQLKALVDFIENEAKYAADEIMNRNDCSDSLRRGEFLEELLKAFGYER